MANVVWILLIAGLLAGLINCQSKGSQRRFNIIGRGHRKLHLRRGGTARIKCHNHDVENNVSRSFNAVHWYRNGRLLVIPDGDSSRFSEIWAQGQYTLNIVNVDDPDQGTYTCKNRLGPGTVLAVGDSPTLIVGPHAILPPRGAQFEIKCLAAGKPIPRIRIFQDEKDITGTSLPTYSGRAVNISILGTSRLACKAENVHGMVWKNATLVPQGLSSRDTNDESSSVLPLVLGGVIGFFVVLAIFLVAVWFNLRRQNGITLTKIAREYNIEEGALSRYRLIPKQSLQSRENSYVDQQCRELEVSRDRIEFTKLIVQGSDYQFSHGYLRSERDNGGKMQVTIKMLKKHTRNKYISKEILLLRQLVNYNILRLTATCTSEDPQLFVFEYCPNGDLKTFLRNRNPKPLDINNIKRYSQMPLPFQNLGLEEKLQIASQICKALRYLERADYIHKDLATRNCFVSESMTIKVSDIGLGLEAYPEDYNLIEVEENSFVHLPLRWTSPESILDMEFSFQSTVWSFGVLLWEIFAYARQPFGALRQDQIIQRIKDGQMLPRPHKCPRDVYEIMKSCWTMSPGQRPYFGALEHQLATIQSGTQV